MVNVKTAAESVARTIGMMKFFPADANTRLGIVRMICEMAADNEQVEWLGRRMIQLHNEWPGPIELRAVFCSKFKPRDGFETYSEIFVEGVPSEDEQKNLTGIASGARLALPGKCEVSADPELDKIISGIARTLKSRYSPARAATQEEVERIKTEQERNRMILEDAITKAKVIS